MVDNQESKELQERIAKALIMKIETERPPLSQLSSQYYPARVAYSATPDDMAQLIRDMQKQLAATQQALANSQQAREDMGRRIGALREQLTERQQALDSAVEALKNLHDELEYDCTNWFLLREGVKTALAT